jgi:hypothetical protein
MTFKLLLDQNLIMIHLKFNSNFKSLVTCGWIRVLRMALLSLSIYKKKKKKKKKKNKNKESKPIYILPKKWMDMEVFEFRSPPYIASP